MPKTLPSVIVIGIDPGVTGAMCILDAANGNIIELKDMPIDRDSNYFGCAYDPYGFKDWCRTWSYNAAVKSIVWVEKYKEWGAYRGNVVELCYQTGRILESLDSYATEVHTVDPNDWQKAFLKRTGKRIKGDTKILSYEAALRLYPTNKKDFSGPRGEFKKTSGRPDAICQARWGLMQYRNQIASKQPNGATK
jgi:hypothetical protein